MTNLFVIPTESKFFIILKIFDEWRDPLTITITNTII
jgi:hypothetical protein